MTEKFIKGDAEIANSYNDSFTAKMNMGLHKYSQQHAHTTLLLAILDEQREANDLRREANETQKELLATFKGIASELTQLREEHSPVRNKRPLLGNYTPKQQ